MPLVNLKKDSRWTHEEIARRIQLGIRRNQVTLGKHNLERLAKRKDAALVWATVDLSRHSRFKLHELCRRYALPMLVWGRADELGEITGQPTVKVYILKSSFSGIGQILRVTTGTTDI